MKKIVLFIPFIDFLKYNKNFNILDGVIYSGGNKNKNKLYSNEFGSLDDCLGEYVSVSINRKGKLEIKTDFCGFYQLFWMEFNFQGKAGVLLSNCIHSISNYNKNYKLDVSVFSGSLFSKNQIFIQNYSNKTSVSNVKRLGWDEVIIIDKTGLTIHKEIKIIEGDYNQLLWKGIDKARRVLFELNSRSEFNLYLSGGKDSRAILALLISMGVFPKCSTRDPVKFTGNSKLIVKKDFNIATSLVEMYNLKWYKLGDKSAVKMDFYESLEHHSFYRNGYYKYTPSQYLVYSHEWGKETQLRGGGGGLYKSTWGDYIRGSYINKNIVGECNSLDSDARVIFNSLVLKQGMKQGFYKECEDVFLGSLKDGLVLNELDIFQCLDRHYISHRNRYHFGHHRASNVEGKNIFCPLINEFFYAASSMLTKEEQKKGKVIFDIIDYCCPELNEYPYDDGYHELLSDNRDRKEFKKSSESIKKYTEVSSLNKLKIKDIFFGKSYDSNLEANNFIDFSISELMDLTGSSFNYKKVMDYIEKTKENKMNKNKLCALFSSVPLNSVSDFSKGHIFSFLGDFNDSLS